MRGYQHACARGRARTYGRVHVCPCHATELPGEAARVQCALHALHSRCARFPTTALLLGMRRQTIISRSLSFSSRSIWKGCDSGCNARRRERDWSPITPRSPDDTTPLGYLSFLTVRVPAADDNYLAPLRWIGPPSTRNINRLNPALNLVRL